MAHNTLVISGIPQKDVKRGIRKKSFFSPALRYRDSGINSTVLHFLDHHTLITTTIENSPEAMRPWSYEFTSQCTFSFKK
jgi:hypothetical protein